MRFSETYLNSVILTQSCPSARPVIMPIKNVLKSTFLAFISLVVFKRRTTAIVLTGILLAVVLIPG